MMEITLQLPDKLHEQAKQWAAITQQELGVALTDALTVILTPVYTTPELEEPVTSLSDDALLAQSEMKMATAQGARFSTLLAEQREETLSDEAHRELFALTQLYQRLWLRQSEALAEAVRRGLRPPLHS